MPQDDHQEREEDCWGPAGGHRPNPRATGRRTGSADRVGATTGDRVRRTDRQRIPSVSTPRAMPCEDVGMEHPRTTTVPSIPDPTLAEFPHVFDAVCTNVARVVRARRSVIQLAVITMFSQGHLLIEDVPGVGKTVLSKALARSIGGRFGRVQFTPDLLPSDVVGTSVWNQSTGDFVFHPGPVFSNVLLADEINRASPKTQSALLEAMAEGHVTVDGQTLHLPDPFVVIATQNPLEHHGTYPLPESQLDRFLMRISMGYPSHEAERELLLDTATEKNLETLSSVVDMDTVSRLSELIDTIHVSDPVADYLIALANGSRTSGRFVLGISPRALKGLLRAARVLAAVRGRSFVSPDDVKGLAVPVLAHRVVPTGARRGADDSAAAIEALLASTAIPG